MGKRRCFAKKYNLANLIAIVDRNNIQIGGDTEKVMPLGDLADKWRSFGWDVQEIDGHDHLAIIQAIDKAKNSRQPSVMIAHTIPGPWALILWNMITVGTENLQTPRRRRGRLLN